MPVISKTDYPFENGSFKKVMKVSAGGEFSCALPDPVAAVLALRPLRPLTTMADYKIPPDVMDVLQRSTIEGNTLRLPEGQLERDLYNRVNKALANAGGHWNRGAKGHVFSGDPRAKLGLMLESGVAVDEQKKYQAFFTPQKLAYQVAGLANVRGHIVLEPSAGQGDLIDACIGHDAKAVHAIELNPENRELLEEKCDAEDISGTGVVTIGDFLEMEPGFRGGKSPGLYTRIVMNPPFTRNQDVHHVEHALKWLAPGGILAAIMLDNPDRPAFQALTEKLDRRIADGLAYSIQHVPGGTFKDTDVHTLILLVKAPAAVAVTPPSPKVTATPPSRTPACLRETGLNTVTGTPPEPDAPTKTKAAVAVTSPSPKVPAAPTPPPSTAKPKSPTPSFMKLNIPRTDLISALAAVKAAARGNALPITGNVLLVARGNELTLTTTDLELHLRKSVDCAIVAEGKLTVRCGLLYDIIRLADGESVNLSQEKHNLTVECGSTRHTLTTLDAEDFPPFPRIKAEKVAAPKPKPGEPVPAEPPVAVTQSPVEFFLEDAIFRALLSETAFAASTDAERYVLNGVLVKIDAGRLNIVGCDGRRIAISTVPVEAPAVSFIMPAKVVQQLLRLLGSDTAKPQRLTVNASLNLVQFTCGGLIILSKLIDGQYPAYQKIMPAENAIATVPRTDLIRSIERIALVADNATLRFGPSALHLASYGKHGNEVIGDASDSLLVASSRAVEVTFCCQYLRDVLGAIGDDALEFHLSDKGVGMFKTPGRDWRGIVAPVQKEEPKAKPAAEAPAPAAAPAAA